MQNDDGLNLENICCPLGCFFPLKNTVILKMNFLIRFLFTITDLSEAIQTFQTIMNDDGIRGSFIPIIPQPHTLFI
jgi:hypothetical protein